MKQLAPQLIELTQDACLFAFWRKTALNRFLRQHGISEAHLGLLNNKDVSKRNYLDKLFGDLVGKKDGIGHKIILSIAKNLSEMNHFPDLENWEDSAQKISKAKQAISRLKIEVDKINKQELDEQVVIERRIKAEERRLQTIAGQQSLVSLGARLTEMVRLQGTQEGGYAFEKWIYDLAVCDDIEARPSYATDGRQIDGSLTVDGTTYLVEAKFTAAKTGSQDIDIFMSKVSSKADNTMGIFISMSGFNAGAVKTASRERTTIILLDYSHVYNLILCNIMSFSDVIRRIRRHVSQTGQAYLAVPDFSG